MNFKLDKQAFLRDGYCIIKNLLDENEVAHYDNKIKKLANGEQFSLGGIYNAKEISDIVANKKLLTVLKELLGPEIFFLHDSSVMHKTEPKNIENWHRDNPCRRFGIGPDWDKELPYDVLRVGIYLQSYNETKSCINVIPGSHKKRYTLKEVLRFFHKKYFSKFNEKSKLGFLKKIFTSLIGKNIVTDRGDCVIFHANLWHTPTETSGWKRAVHFSYGRNNKHSKHFVNYYLKHRSDITKDGHIIDEDFIKLLQKEKIYYPIPTEKIEIPGVNRERPKNYTN